jgi:hypothetical protein
VRECGRDSLDDVMPIESNSMIGSVGSPNHAIVILILTSLDLQCRQGHVRAWL